MLTFVHLNGALSQTSKGFRKRSVIDMEVTFGLILNELTADKNVKLDLRINPK